MAEPEDLEGVMEFPWEMTFTKSALKRAVSTELGGLEVTEVTILHEGGAHTWEAKGERPMASTVLLQYLLANGTVGSARFAIYVMPSEEGITVHFGAQSVQASPPS